MGDPIRIRRRRTKGFNLQAESPDGRPVVYVGRPTMWGNPFDGSPEGLAAYSRLVNGIVRPEMHDLGDVTAWQARIQPFGHPAEVARSWLRGKHLACFCPLDCPCHADVLLDLANR